MALFWRKVSRKTMSTFFRQDRRPTGDRFGVCCWHRDTVLWVTESVDFESVPTRSFLLDCFWLPRDGVLHGSRRHGMVGNSCDGLSRHSSSSEVAYVGRITGDWGAKGRVARKVVHPFPVTKCPNNSGHPRP